MKKVWIFDIDGTLANIDHRIHHIKNTENKDWNSFFENQHLDPPYEPVINVLNSIDYKNYEDRIIFVTARPEKYRSVTYSWLYKYVDYFGEFDEDFNFVYMRPDNNSEDDDVLKVNIINQWLKDNPDYEVGAIFEDRPTVIKAFRKQGWYVFDCNQSGTRNYGEEEF